MLENNIQMALSQQMIELEDAIDLRNIKNVKLANQLLKVRRKKKQERDQLIQEKNIKTQAEANASSQKQAAEAEVQKDQALTASKMQLEQGKAELEKQRLLHEAQIKKELMNHEFAINMRLKQAELQVVNSKEAEKEDRKDERTRIQASQQSELIDQRNNNKPPKKFESMGNDSLGDLGNLGMYDPR